MSTTTISDVVLAAKAGLREGINNLDGYDGVPVSWGHPLKALEKTHVWIGNLRSTQEWASIGDRQRSVGPAAFELHIFVTKEGSTVEDVELAALALLAPVETWLRVNETAGVDLAQLPGCKHMRLAVERVDMQSGAADQAIGTLITVDISLVARI